MKIQMGSGHFLVIFMEVHVFSFCFDTSYPQNGNASENFPILPYKRGLNKPFLMFGVSATKVSDILSVFMEIHVFCVHFSTSYRHSGFTPSGGKTSDLQHQKIEKAPLHFLP